MAFFPHKTVAVVVEQPDWLKTAGDETRRFLMVEEHSDGRLVFNQPAGHLEADESLQQAALRETLEETAWQVTLTGFVGLYQYTSPENGECYIRSCFAGTAVSHDAGRSLDPDIIRSHWLSLSELEQRSSQLRSPIVLQVLHDYLAGQCYPLTLVKYLT